jgi:hypothetical protein
MSATVIYGSLNFISTGTNEVKENYGTEALYEIQTTGL